MSADQHHQAAALEDDNGEIRDGVARKAPAGPDLDVEEDYDDAPCWCGEENPYYGHDGLPATCGGGGILHCRCGGDQCVCHYHGETECLGCEDCMGDEWDEDDEWDEVSNG